MSAPSGVPGAQRERCAAYLDRLASAAGHQDRAIPLKSYCIGLLLPGERKSVEPMAARLCPGHVRQAHQSLHHVVADAPWDDTEVLEAVRQYVLPVLQKRGPLKAWIVEDTCFKKKGTHSVGVTRQSCGQLGKPENCRVAVSLSLSTSEQSLPIAWRLYLPEVWTENPKARKATGIPSEIRFQSKPEIARQQIRAAVQRQIPTAPVLADATYGTDTRFRASLRELGLPYVVGIQPWVSVWPRGQAPLPSRRGKSLARPKLLGGNRRPRALAARELAVRLPSSAWKTVRWREGTRHSLRSRFAAVRVRPVHREYAALRSAEWLLIEWPSQAAEPTRYWLSALTPETELPDLVRLAKHRWIIERDHQELKHELGLGHFEGRGWRGFHHHATLCIAAYGFLVAERSRFSSSVRAGQLDLPVPEMPTCFRPRGAPRAAGKA